MKKLRLKSNDATVLTFLGAFGLVATAVLTAKETPKALQLLEEAEKENEQPLTITEKVIVATPTYLPAIAVGASSILCIFGANILNKRTQASLMSAYTMADNLYRDYRNKNIELYGEENDKAIMEEICRYNSSYHQIGGVTTPDAKVRWCEPISGRFFEAYEREIMDAEYHFNRNYTLRGAACVNELFEFLGLPECHDGDTIGWDMSSGICWVDFIHTLAKDSQGEYYIIDTEYSPDEIDEYYL